MVENFEGEVDQALVDQALEDHINSLVASQDATSPSPKNGLCIPQKRYAKGAGRSSANNQNIVLFVLQDGIYMPVNAALDEDYTGLVNRDLPGLPGAGFTITVRFEWPGYLSHDFQLRTYDWCTPPKRVSLAKLATEMGKIVRQFIERMQAENIAPEHAQWRVGPNGIQLKDLRLAALEQVSAGSYQPRLFYKP